MSQSKQRAAKIGSDVERIAKFINAYQQGLKSLILGLPLGHMPVNEATAASVGKCEIWPCTDGAVVLIYSDPVSSIDVRIKTPLTMDVNNFLASAKVFANFDAEGKKLGGLFGIKIENAFDNYLVLALPRNAADGTAFRPQFQAAHMIGWKAQLPLPEVLAKENFEFVYQVRNLLGDEALNKPKLEVAALASAKTSDLIQTARGLIASASKEEDVQVFLKAHPELIYPEFIECYPKFKLGDDFVTDFVFLIQDFNGPHYVFVELEWPGKNILIDGGQFSAPFSQAKDQLNNWERWLTHHLSYAKEKLPGLFRPTFHLIMGRGEGLDATSREKVQLEFQGTSKKFSTYDDVLDRFELMAKRFH